MAMEEDRGWRIKLLSGASPAGTGKANIVLQVLKTVDFALARLGLTAGHKGQDQKWEGF